MNTFSPNNLPSTPFFLVLVLAALFPGEFHPANLICMLLCATAPSNPNQPQPQTIVESGGGTTNPVPPGN